MSDSAARPRGDSAAISIRALTTQKEFADAVQLQREIWGFNDLELLPVHDCRWQVERDEAREILRRAGGDGHIRDATVDLTADGLGVCDAQPVRAV